MSAWQACCVVHATIWHESSCRDPLDNPTAGLISEAIADMLRSETRFTEPLLFAAGSQDEWVCRGRQLHLKGGGSTGGAGEAGLFLHLALCYTPYSLKGCTERVISRKTSSLCPRDALCIRWKNSTTCGSSYVAVSCCFFIPAKNTRSTLSPPHRSRLPP
jgi:hypothetical protein